MDIPIEYIKYVNEHGNTKTFDDFFDHVGVPQEQRSDFVVAAILKQAREIYQNEEGNE